MNLHYILRKYLFFSLKSNMQCSIIHGFSHNRLVNKNLMNNKTPDLTRSEVTKNPSIPVKNQKITL